MADSSDIVEMRGLLRKEIRDELCTQWSDSALNEILFDANREYAFYGKTLKGVKKFSTVSGRMSLPEDFLEADYCLNDENRVIPIVSWKELQKEDPMFRVREDARIDAVCFDYDGYGFFRTYPIVPDGTVMTLHYTRTTGNEEAVFRNKDAVLKHALFQIGMMTGLGGVDNYWDGFMKEIMKETSLRHPVKNRKDRRYGQFF